MAERPSPPHRIADPRNNKRHVGQSPDSNSYPQQKTPSRSIKKQARTDPHQFLIEEATTTKRNAYDREAQRQRWKRRFLRLKAQQQEDSSPPAPQATICDYRPTAVLQPPNTSHPKSPTKIIPSKPPTTNNIPRQAKPIEHTAPQEKQCDQRPPAPLQQPKRIPLQSSTKISDISKPLMTVIIPGQGKLVEHPEFHPRSAIKYLNYMQDRLKDEIQRQQLNRHQLIKYKTWFYLLKICPNIEKLAEKAVKTGKRKPMRHRVRQLTLPQLQARIRQRQTNNLNKLKHEPTPDYFEEFQFCQQLWSKYGTGSHYRPQSQSPIAVAQAKTNIGYGTPPRLKLKINPRSPTGPAEELQLAQQQCSQYVPMFRPQAHVTPPQSPLRKLRKAISVRYQRKQHRRTLNSGWKVAVTSILSQPLPPNPSPCLSPSGFFLRSPAIPRATQFCLCSIVDGRLYFFHRGRPPDRKKSGA